MTVHTVLVEKHTVQMYIVLIDVLFMSNYECYVVSLIPVLQSLTPPIYAIVPKLAHFGKHFLPLLWLVLTYQFPKSAEHSLYSLDQCSRTGILHLQLLISVSMHAKQPTWST